MNHYLNISGWIIRSGLALFGSALIACAQPQSFQQLKVQVVPDAARVVIQGSSASRTSWSFPDAYGGVLGLGTRIVDFQVFDQQGSLVEVRQKAPGQFVSVTPASSFKYAVNLTPPTRSADAALVSWVDAERGVLVPNDLFPEGFLERTNLTLEVPPAWHFYSAQITFSGVSYGIVDSGRFVIIVGKTLRLSKSDPAGLRFNLISDGNWPFQDSEALRLSERILKKHRALAGPVPCEQTTLTVLPLPGNAPADKWSALTRGCAVTILMGKQPSSVGALSQLGNALTHELFHLWVPNGLSLDGDYDWFYEGFTVYHAASVAVDLDLLTFGDFLAALARAYDAITSARELDQLSLLEASKRRFTTGAAGVYSKAMLVAFLYDLNLRYQSKGKRSLDTVYRNVFSSQARDKQKTDGNAFVLATLRAEFDAQDFVTRFVTQPVNIDLQSELAPFGLRVEKFGFRTRIVVAGKLTKRQGDLLGKLGYNDQAR